MMFVDDSVSPLLEEIFQMCICASLGYVFFYSCRVYTSQPKIQQLLRTSKINDTVNVTQASLVKASPSLASTLPVDVTISLAKFLDLADIAQLSAASHSMRNACWTPHELWAAFAYDMDCPAPVPMNGEAAEQFRQSFFRIQGDRPRALLSKARNGSESAAEILEEATHMLRGMMPQDDPSSLYCVLEAAVDAIYLHEASNERAAQSVKSFLQLARRRSDLVFASQLEQLEDAYSTMQNLQSSLEFSVEQAGQEAEAAVEAELMSLWCDGLGIDTMED